RGEGERGPGGDGDVRVAAAGGRGDGHVLVRLGRQADGVRGGAALGHGHRRRRDDQRLLLGGVVVDFGGGGGCGGVAGPAHGEDGGAGHGAGVLGGGQGRGPRGVPVARRERERGAGGDAQVGVAAGPGGVHGHVRGGGGRQAG